MNGRVLLLPVGLKDGRPVLISEIPEAESGRNCGCVCPNCGGPLVAIQGPFQQPHFTHERVDCAYDARNATLVGLLEMAREILLLEKRIMLPGLEITDENEDEPPEEPGTMRGPVRRRRVAYPGIVSVTDAHFEREAGEPIPRLVVETGRGPVQVELLVRRQAAKSAQKASEYRGGGCAAIEIDLSRTTYPEILDRGSLRSLLVFNTVNKDWLHDDRRQEAERDLREAERSPSVDR